MFLLVFMNDLVLVAFITPVVFIFPPEEVKPIAPKLLPGDIFLDTVTIVPEVDMGFPMFVLDVVFTIIIA